MGTFTVQSQADWDALPKAFEEYTQIELCLPVGDILEIRHSARGAVVIADVNSAPHLVVWGNAAPHVEAWGNAAPRVVARNKSAPYLMTRGSATPQVVAWDNSVPYIVVRGNSAPCVEAWDNSAPQVVAWDNSALHIVARGNSAPHVMARDNSALHINGGTALIGGQAVCWNLGNAMVTTQDAGQVITPAPKSGVDAWLKRHGIVPSALVILYKRVSKDFLTQEGSRWQTEWRPGSLVQHPAWNPTLAECGAGKFHACPRPYFCDEFRGQPDDRYVAIEIAKKDLFVWNDRPKYPHKIGFCAGRVLFECNQIGVRV